MARSAWTEGDVGGRDTRGSRPLSMKSAQISRARAKVRRIGAFRVCAFGPAHYRATKALAIVASAKWIESASLAMRRISRYPSAEGRLFWIV
jgi:hypothetical protein